MAVKHESEKSFMAAVVQFAELNQWATHHTYDSRRSESGVPDLMFVKAGRLVFAELKVGKNKATVDQRLWLDLLATVPGVKAFLWTPDDWPEIARVLGPESK